MRFLGVPVAAALLTAALLPATATAARGGVAFNCDVNIVQEPTRPGPAGGFTNTGTCTASGAVSGSFTISEQSFEGGGNSPGIHAVDTLTGSYGTITIDVQTKFTGASGPYAYFTGVWTITGGTARYGNLQGTGDETGTVYRSGSTHTLAESMTGWAGSASTT